MHSTFFSDEVRRSTCSQLHDNQFFFKKLLLLHCGKGDERRTTRVSFSPPFLAALYFKELSVISASSICRMCGSSLYMQPQHVILLLFRRLLPAQDLFCISDL